MTMIDSLKARLIDARKGGRSTVMGTLQVILGDASMIEARTGKKATDDEVEKIVRKLIVGNTETIDLMKTKGLGDSPDVQKRLEENTFLATLLPKSMSVEEIKAALAPVLDAIKAAKADGQATGVAMKHLKAGNFRAQGEDVTQAVRQLRQ